MLARPSILSVPTASCSVSTNVTSAPLRADGHPRARSSRTTVYRWFCEPVAAGLVAAPVQIVPSRRGGRAPQRVDELSLVVGGPRRARALRRGGRHSRGAPATGRAALVL